MPASRKSFLTVAYASSITFDADQAKNFQVTLTGSPSLVIAGGQEGDEIGILLIQGGSGSYTVTWPSNVSFAASAAPNLNTAVGGTDLITLVKRGSTWQDKAGAPTKLPSQIRSGALGTVIGVGITSLFTLISSAGNGQQPGNSSNPNFYEFRTGTGATQETVGKFNASGSLILGQTGSLALGSSDLTLTNAKFLVTPAGAMTAKSTLSGSKLTVNAASAGSGKVIVHGSDGGGFCLQDTDGAGWTFCSALNGVLICGTAHANFCP